MKAAVITEKGKLELRDISMPQTGDYDCLVKMEACVFCNSTDRHLVEGTFVAPTPYPAVLGHESIGRIEKCGKKVKNFKVGDRVLRAYALYPDEKSGELSSAWGGFAEYGKIIDCRAMEADGEKSPGFSYMQKVPDDIPLEKALLLITQKEIYSAAVKIESPGGKKFLIAGAGAAGCLFALFLRKFGAEKVTLAARRPEQLAFALDNALTDAAMQLPLTAVSDEKYDALVDASGSTKLVRDLMAKCIKKAGCVYSYAVYPEMSEPDKFKSFTEEFDFRRIDPAEYSAHDAVCELLRTGQLDPAPLITHKFGIDDLEAAWNTVTGKKTVKTVILFYTELQSKSK